MSAWYALMDTRLRGHDDQVVIQCLNHYMHPNLAIACYYLRLPPWAWHMNCIFTHSGFFITSLSDEESRWVLGYGCILFAL